MKYESIDRTAYIHHKRSSLFGREKEGHKYYARVKNKNPKYNWKYFYTKAAYQSYMKGKDATEYKIEKSDDTKVEKKIHFCITGERGRYKIKQPEKYCKWWRA